MDAEKPTTAVDAGAFAELQNEVSQLSDLFRRRLFEDRSKNALIEDVQEHLRTARDLLRYREFEGLFKEALLAIDRLQHEPATPELAASVADELLESFRRRKLTEVDASGDFDPRFHEVVGTVLASGEVPPNTIAAVQRTGYLLADRLLRPAQVTLAVDSDDREG